MLCVLLVEGMCIVLTVMLSLTSVIIPPIYLVHAIDVHGGDVIYFVSFCYRDALGFRNCDDFCMCVVNKPF